VPKNLALLSAGFMELPAGLHSKQQFVKSTHPGMWFQSQALWLWFKGTRKGKVIRA